MLNDLVNVCDVTRADFTENTLEDPEGTTDDPETLVGV